MKHSLTILITLAAAALLISYGGFSRTQAQAAAVTTIAKYKVIDMSKIALVAGKTSAETLEILLNDQAAQGWRLAQISGSLIILVSD